MHSAATSVTDYISSLPEERRQEVARLRDLILANLPQGYKEGMDFGMITYSIPLDVFPKTYNGRPLCYAGIASQKNYISLYLLGAYATAEEESHFREEYKKTGKKLDMGKSCIRFKKVDDLALDVIARHIASITPEQFIAIYERSRS